MAFAGVWCVARDVLGLIPSLVATLPIPGVSFGIQASPMRLSVGFLVGGRSVAWWMVGAVLGSFGIVVGGTAAGLWDIAGARVCSPSSSPRRRSFAAWPSASSRWSRWRSSRSPS